MVTPTPDPSSPRTFAEFPSGVSRFVSASFADLDDAIDATRELERRGYPRDRLSVFMATDARDRYIDTYARFNELESQAVVVEDVELEKHRKTAEGAGAGGAAGGALGAAGAAIAAAGTTLVFPPLGIAIAGPAAAMLAGLGAGAAAGGLVGALVGAGMTEYRAARFAELIGEEKIVVGVVVDTEPERHAVLDVLSDHGGDVVSDDD